MHALHRPPVLWCITLDLYLRYSLDLYLRCSLWSNMARNKRQ